MRVFILLLLTFISFSITTFAQDSISDTAIEFPTINLDGDPDQMALDNGEQKTCNGLPETKKKRHNLAPATNYGFYTDIIAGTIVLLVGLIGWNVYQRFRPRED